MTTPFKKFRYSLVNYLLTSSQIMLETFRINDDFPVTNLYNDKISNRAKLDQNTVGAVIVNLRLPISVNYVALLNHDLSDDAAVTIQANNTNIWTTPAVNIVASYRSKPSSDYFSTNIIAGAAGEYVDIPGYTNIGVWVLSFDNGSGAWTIDDIVTSAGGASGQVLNYEVTGGTVFGGNEYGFLYLRDLSGTFIVGESITSPGGGSSLVSDPAIFDPTRIVVWVGSIPQRPFIDYQVDSEQGRIFFPVGTGIIAGTVLMIRGGYTGDPGVTTPSPHLVVELDKTESYQFWRIEIDDLYKPNNYVMLGVLSIGILTELERNFEWNFQEQNETISIDHQSDGGVKWNYKLYENKLFELAFSFLSEEQYLQLEPFIKTVESSKQPFLMIVQETPYYMRMLNNPVISRPIPQNIEFLGSEHFPIDYDVDGFQLQEEVLGVVIDETELYNINAVNFDGSVYLTSGSPLTNVVDGKTGILSTWIKFADGTDGTYMILAGVGNIGAYGVQLVRLATNELWMRFYQSYPGLVGLTVTLPIQLLAGSWYHILLSWDMDQQLGTNEIRVNAYINDMQVVPIVVAVPLATLAYGQDGCGVGSGGGAANILAGDMADFYLNFNTYLDFSQSGTRRRFINNNGNPVDSGVDGSLPTRSVPDIFLTGETNTWVGNKGTSNDYTEMSGTLTTSSTIPETVSQPDIIEL